MKLTFEGTTTEFTELVDSVIFDSLIIEDEEEISADSFSLDSTVTIEGYILDKKFPLIFVRRVGSKPLAIDCSGDDSFQKVQIGDSVKLKVELVPADYSNLCSLHLKNCEVIC